MVEEDEADEDDMVADPPFTLVLLCVEFAAAVAAACCGDGNSISTLRSFCRFRLRRRHRSEAFAKCQALRGRM